MELSTFTASILVAMNDFIPHTALPVIYAERVSTVEGVVCPFEKDDTDCVALEGAD